MKNLWKHINLARIAALQKQGSIYFPVQDMILKYPFLLLFNGIIILKSNIFNSCIIHTIGDSHAKPFIFQWPFLVHHISQATAHNLIKEGSFTRSGEYLRHFLSRVNKKRDIVFLIFGEIDARVHIYLKYGESGKQVSIDKLLDDTVARYGEAITQIQGNGYHVAIHGIPPASSKDFITALPFSGKPGERSEISRKFNEKLKAFCRSVDVHYVDIQSVASDEKGFIKKYYLADEVHCNRRIVSFTRKTIVEAFKSKKRF